MSQQQTPTSSRTYVYPNVDDLEGADKVGSKQCVALVQIEAGAPVTSTWRAGATVRGNTTLARGTAIATFVDGRYANAAHGNHAALYMGQDATGITVMDQWTSDKTKPHISSRHIAFKGRNRDGSYIDPSNTMPMPFRLSRPAIRILVVGLALFATRVEAASAPIVMQCPLRIATEQSLHRAVADWRGERRDVGHVYDGFGFFDGPVAKNTELTPSSSTKSGDLYDFGSLVEPPVRFICRYRGTDVMLTRPLPTGLKKCSVSSTRAAHSGDRVTIRCG